MDNSQDCHFIDACRHGNLNEAKLLLAKHPDINVYIWSNTPFRVACKYGHLDLAKWLLENYPQVDVHAEGEYAFRYACEGGYLELAKWLVEVSESMGKPVDVHAKNEDAFISACSRGHLDLVKWFLETFPYIDVSADCDDALRFSFSEGHLDTAKFLLPFCGALDMGAKTDILFRIVSNHHFDIAEWFCEKYPDAYVSSKFFVFFCDSRNLETAKWFVGKYGRENLEYDLCFDYSCTNGHLEMCQWLAETFPQVNVRDGYFTALARNKIDVVRWLVDKYPEICS